MLDPRNFWFFCFFFPSPLPQAPYFRKFGCAVIVLGLLSGYASRRAAEETDGSRNVTSTNNATAATPAAALDPVIFPLEVAASALLGIVAALVGIVVMPLTSSSEAAARVRVAFELTSRLQVLLVNSFSGRQYRQESDTEPPVHPSDVRALRVDITQTLQQARENMQQLREAISLTAYEPTAVCQLSKLNMAVMGTKIDEINRGKERAKERRKKKEKRRRGSNGGERRWYVNFFMSCFLIPALRCGTWPLSDCCARPALRLRWRPTLWTRNC